jgi:undecaprenyl-diphosphatase
VGRLLKIAFGRLRPVYQGEWTSFSPLTFNPAYHSLPSGHAIGAFALATSLSLFFPKWKKVWYFFGSVCAFSRILLGHHYVSDVVCGALLGMGVAVCVHKKIEQARGLLDS